MTANNDQLLTRLTVRITDVLSNQTLGSGIIYSQKKIKDSIYILTAAHCLYKDADQFKSRLNEIQIDIFNPSKNLYIGIKHKINYNLVSSNVNDDLAVLVLDKTAIETITGELPEIKVIKERQSVSEFVVKGFPSSTKGKELVLTHLTWIQNMPTVPKFQLHLNQDFSTPESARSMVDGFSGSGVCLISHSQIYLIGIFTRFLEPGKVVYCQYLDSVNNLLESCFLPSIQFTFLGEYGLSAEFFSRSSALAIKNLGPRFDADLNFKLPIALLFSDLAKDIEFKRRLSTVIDKYLATPNYRTATHEWLKGAESEFKQFDNDLRAWFANLTWSPSEKIEIDPILQKLQDFNEKAQELISQFYKLRYDKEEKNTSDLLFQSEISALREMKRQNEDLIRSFDHININLSNQRRLIIKGDAGSGKSHLLGDITQNRNQNNLPTILLLGQLFKSGFNVWQNIQTQLNLNCTKEEFLKSLNHIGKQIGSRILVMVDALNEGAGKDLWFNELPGFIQEFTEYPYIGLVLTVRTTYWDAVIPPSIKNDEQFSIETHQGFRGNEYAALKLFCDHHGILQPDFPLLAPEYANPLFLQLVCRGIAESNEKVFSQSFQGFSKIFNFYTKALVEELSKKRDEYALRPNLVKEALELFSIKSFENTTSKSLSLNEVNELFDLHFGKFPLLLKDLVEESVFIRSIDQQEEVIYFAFERFGDFYIAEQLLSKYQTEEEIRVAFSKNNVLGKLMQNDHWNNWGIMEVFSVLLPERFGIEIIEVYDWIFIKKNKLTTNIDDWLNRWMVDSMKWREIKSINKSKIIDWVRNSNNFNMDLGNWYYFLLEMTAVKDHPFNADYVHEILSNHTMAERDGFWQDHMHGYHGTNDQHIDFPITHLINWAWQDDISKKTDEETSRLTGQTLCWVLASTNRGLRDQVTKALVNLLQDQTLSLIKIFKKFEGIDDLYILERLYAVAYGCALRSNNVEQLKQLSQYIYDTVFKHGNPPEHILLRDYARGVIEFALFKGLILDLDKNLIKPPYNSKLPESFPTEEDVKKYDLNQEEGSVNNYERAEYMIYSSVMSYGDFSRYTLDGAIERFAPIRFTIKKEIEEFKASLKRGGKAALKRVEDYFFILNTSESKNKKKFLFLDDEQGEKIWASLNDYSQKQTEKLDKLLDDNQRAFLANTIIPYWRARSKANSWKSQELEKTPFRCWIVQRVFELGYATELHGSYDNPKHDYIDHRTDSRVERIGKKYQWIAFYQLLAILTDNYKVRERGSSDNIGHYYQGPWELMIRNIDPSFILRGSREKYDDEDFGLKSNPEDWWGMKKYDYWDRIPSDWAVSKGDLPNQVNCIQKTDDKNTDWLYLNLNNKWMEPKSVGEEKYKNGYKEIWYLFQAYLVKKKDKTNAVTWLKKQDFRGRNIPEDYATTDLLAREHYWAPISKQQLKGAKEWITFGQSNFKVVLTNRYGVGELSEDKSGAHFYYQMPCKLIYEGMKLNYGRKDGEFVNEQGEIVLTNESTNGLMIKKNEFMAYLKKHDLDVIWVHLGEKNYFTKNYDNDSHRKSISGVYYFEDDIIVGDIVIGNW